MRLQKYMAKSGVASRRRCENIIAEGRVKVNGKVVLETAVQIDPDSDIVSVDGKIVKPETYVYLLMNKPEGYITTARDTHNRSTVMELLPPVKQRVYPVGRLDADTAGALLFTNDGGLAHHLTHPKYGVIKTYNASVRGLPTDETIRKMRRGIMLDDGITAPASVKIIKHGRDTALLSLELREGKKREVKRLCAAVGHPVLSLERVKFAFLDLEGLPRGITRFLTPGEILRLRKL